MKVNHPPIFINNKVCKRARSTPNNCSAATKATLLTQLHKQPTDLLQSLHDKHLCLWQKTIIVQVVKHQEEQLQVPWQFPEHKGISSTSKAWSSISSAQHTPEKSCLLHRDELPKWMFAVKLMYFNCFISPMEGTNILLLNESTKIPQSWSY